MGEELAKLLEAGFIRDIKHPDWLANLVMVPKKDKSWRLCVDFKDLNKAFPKDPFPSPALIKSLTPPQDTIHCVSSMHIRIPSNQNEGVRSSCNNIYYPIQAILLQHHALQAQERRRDIPTHDSNMPGETDRQNGRSLRR